MNSIMHSMYEVCVPFVIEKIRKDILSYLFISVLPVNQGCFINVVSGQLYAFHQ